MNLVILHFAEYASGGVATYLKDLISAQCKLDYVTKIYVLLSKKNSDSELLNFTNQKVIIMPYDYKRSVYGVLKLLRETKKINRINPDVIHIHSSFAGLIRLKFIFSSLKNKAIYCSHGWPFNRDINKLNKLFYQLIEGVLALGCQRIINISKSESSNVMFIPSRKMETIYNSIPERKNEEIKSVNTYNKNTKSINLLFVGRLDRQKGVDILIKALNMVNKDGYFKLGVVGDTVINPIFEKNNDTNIKFYGWQKKQAVQNFIDACNVLIIPSRWEGFGLVALEGMRAGKAIVASNAGALPEIVDNNKTGFIFNSESIKDLCSVLEHLRNLSADEIEKLGLNGKIKFKNQFNYEDMVSKIMKVYDEIFSLND